MEVTRHYLPAHPSLLLQGAQAHPRIEKFSGVVPLLPTHTSAPCSFFLWIILDNFRETTDIRCPEPFSGLSQRLPLL